MAKFCSTCGAQLSEAARFCPGCGAPLYSQPSAPAPAAPKKKSKAPLLIGGAVALVVLIVVIALAGRGGGNTPNPPVTFGNNNGQTAAPSGNIDHPIVGKWSSDASGSIDWYDGIGNFVMTSGMYSQYEFKADGTFSEFCFWTSTPQTRGAREWTRGNYWIEDTGNGTFTLHLTDKLVSLNYNDKTEFEYKDRAFADSDYTDLSISFWDDGSVRLRIISLYFKVE